MRRLWLPLTIVGWLFVCVGCTSLGRAVAASLRETSGSSGELWITAASGAVALVGGAGLLRAWNWARWVCGVWMGAHVVISLMHGIEQLLMHVLIFGVIAAVLWNRRASESLRGGG